jgi:hypothetical protein
MKPSTDVAHIIRATLGDCRDLIDLTHRAILVNMNPSQSLDLAIFETN